MFGPDDSLVSWTSTQQAAWGRQRGTGRSAFVREFVGQFLRGRRVRGMITRLPLYVLIVIVGAPLIQGQTALLGSVDYYISAIPRVLGFIVLFLTLALLLGITQGISRWKLFEEQYTAHEQDPALFQTPKA